MIIEYWGKGGRAAGRRGRDAEQTSAGRGSGNGIAGPSGLIYALAKGSGELAADKNGVHIPKDASEVIILLVNPKPGNYMAGMIMLPPSKKCALPWTGQKSEDVFAVSVPSDCLIAADSVQFSMSYRRLDPEYMGYTPKTSDRSFTAKFAVPK